MENFNISHCSQDHFDYNLVDVKSIDETAAEIKNSGGYVVQPKYSMLGFGCMAFLKNAQGMLFGVWQKDVSAQPTKSTKKFDPFA